MKSLVINSSERAFFFLKSSTDGRTGVTGATATVTLSKNGASFSAYSGSVVEVNHGWYYITLSSSDTNTLGELLIHVEAAGCDDYDNSINIVYPDSIIRSTEDQTELSHIVIIRGDAYDGVSRPKFSWTVGPSINGKNFVASFKNILDGTVQLQVTGTGASDQLQLSILSSETETLTPTPRNLVGSQYGIFDIEVGMATDSYITPVFGTFEVIGDATLPSNR